MPDIFLKRDRSGLQDSQSNTQTILLQSHASLRLTDCILVLYFWKRTHRIWMAAYAVPKPLLFTDVQIACHRNKHALLPLQVLAFKLCASNNLNCHFPLRPEGQNIHDVYKLFEMLICICR